jgi:poly-gamma-glutamate capsule biosynthesis protein CapA/YwtB (metallophosphatase superfamily)
VLIVLALFFISIGWRILQKYEARPAAAVKLRGVGDILTIAATGDTLMLGDLPLTDGKFTDAIRVIQESDMGLTNLDEDLLDPSHVPSSDPPGIPRWLYGTETEAADLARAGFTVVSLANNHAADYGEQGIRQTVENLDQAGLLHAGAGPNLALARAPVYVGAGLRRVAIVAVAVSAAPESRATYTHGEIKGRPGVNVLKYAPDVMVGPDTFATLQKMAPTVQKAPKANGESIILFGTVITKGPQTSVNFIPDGQDNDDILAQIKTARSKAEVVVVMLHSHEPSNQSQVPADFVERFAHSAIDAGATLVIGQGPHQLRGIEIYKGGAILYSLGNFIFDFGAVNPQTIDAYDRGVDLYRLAMGSLSEAQMPPLPRFEEPVWWESVIAVAKIEHGSLRSIQLQPIDLGVGLPLEKRGTPRMASPERADEILRRLAQLSKDFGIQIRVENGQGIIDLRGRDPVR